MEHLNHRKFKLRHYLHCGGVRCPTATASAAPISVPPAGPLVPVGRVRANNRHLQQFASPAARSMPRHAVEFRNRVEVVDPRLLRANKYLPARHQFISLAQRSKPQRET
jgi:hypothetical protein